MITFIYTYNICIHYEYMYVYDIYIISKNELDRDQGVETWEGLE